jgi:hypothetical protein
LHRGDFDRASSGKGVNGKDVSKAKDWQTYLRKKDETIITKAEKWPKPSQKRRMARLSQKLKSGQDHLRKEGQNNFHNI